MAWAVELHSVQRLGSGSIGLFQLTRLLVLRPRDWIIPVSDRLVVTRNDLISCVNSASPPTVYQDSSFANFNNSDNDPAPDSDSVTDSGSDGDYTSSSDRTSELLQLYGLSDQDWGWDESEVDIGVIEEDEGTAQDRLVEEEELHTSGQILTVWHKHSRLLTQRLLLGLLA